MSSMIVFYIAAFAALLGAVMVLVLPNPIRSAMALIMSLSAMSVIYLMLHAQFVAVMQLLVYAGAIMVLFVFVIMLLNLQQLGFAHRGWWVTGAVTVAIATASFAGARALGVSNMSFARSGETPNLVRALPDQFGSVEQVGELLLRDLVLPFEMLSLLLLVAVLGAVVIAKKRL